MLKCESEGGRREYIGLLLIHVFVFCLCSNLEQATAETILFFKEKAAVIL